MTHYHNACSASKLWDKVLNEIFNDFSENLPRSFEHALGQNSANFTKATIIYAI